MQTNRLIHGNCLDVMAAMQSDTIPCTVTSPPYDKIRRYGDHPWNWDVFRSIAHELYRLTMPGGIVAWIVRDQIKDGTESGTTARQSLYFMDSVGFSIFQRLYLFPCGSRPSPQRYRQNPDIALILSKGKPAKNQIELLNDCPSKGVGNRKYTHSRRSAKGKLQAPPARTVVTGSTIVRPCSWGYSTGRHVAQEGYIRAASHGALLDFKIARDLIRTYSREGQLVFDPLCGLGTVPTQAFLWDRQYLGVEVHKPFYDLACRRLVDAIAKKCTAESTKAD